MHVEAEGDPMKQKARSAVVYAIWSSVTGEYDDGDGGTAEWPHLHYYSDRKHAEEALADYDAAFKMRIVEVLIAEIVRKDGTR